MLPATLIDVVANHLFQKGGQFNVTNSLCYFRNIFAINQNI